ncbi:MAG: sigma-70 family RNA polymerase sigma factor [Elusimicrobia bacterium]|nr:sigma-70 family RNA polymerase sigma factor [Elusimicrobiota bacterium]
MAEEGTVPEDIGVVYDRFFPRVYNYMRYRAADRETADDLTSQVFEKVLAKLGSFKPERGPFEAWLFAVARNVVNDHYRGFGWRRWLSLDAVADRPARESPPDAALVKDESLRSLQAALGRLDGREREILGLKFGAGLTNRAIAAMEALSESNVGVVVFRALKKLREELKGEAA